MSKIGGFLTFAAIACLGIVGWIFNWFCWRQKICCFKVYHNPIIQRTFWWLSFTLLCGILACCISGIVIAVRFGKYTRVAQCGYERIYYDSQFGQLKDSYPRWEGLYNNSIKLKNTLKFVNAIDNFDNDTFDNIFPAIKYNWKPDNYQNLFNGNYSDSYIESINSLIELCKIYDSDLEVIETGDKFFNKKDYKDTSTIIGNFIYESDKKIKELTVKYDVMEESIENIYAYGDAYNDELNSTVNDFDGISIDLQNYQTGYLEKVEYYVKVAKGCGYILIIVYLSILALISTLGSILLLAYAYLQNQKYIYMLMIIIWNFIRFFVFSFFVYGAAFGMLFKGLRDVIAYNMYIFGNNLNKNTTTYLLPNNQSKSFLWNCLQEENTNFKGDLDDIVTDDLKGFSNSYDEINTLLNKEENKPIINFQETYTVKKVSSRIRNLQDSSGGVVDFSDEESKFDISDDITDDNEITIPFTDQIRELKNMINQIRESFNCLKDKINQGNSNLRNIEENSIDFSFESLNSFDCGFLKNDLNLLYNSLYDLSVQSRILCVLSCCIGFFGELLTYFYLLTMYHYDNNIFKESQLNINRTKSRNKHNKNNLSNLENSSKNEFLDKSKPGNIKKFNQKLDMDYSAN